MLRTHTLSRRRFLRGAAGLTAALSPVIAACDALSTSPDSGRSSAPHAGTSDRQGREAPMLRAQVRSGKLPSLDKRLPEHPMVVQPASRPGRYGGTWRSVLLGPEEAGYIYTYAHYENLLNWKPTQTGEAGTVDLMPDVAESFEVNADGTQFTFRLRAGMKWSDGEPFTADDVVFAVQDVLLNKEITPALPAILATAGNEPPKIEKLDDHAVTFTFPHPAGLFLQNLVWGEGNAFTINPRHYLKQFHKKYNPDVDELAKKEKVSNWIELFNEKRMIGTGDEGLHPDLPTLGAWRLITPFGPASNRVVLERNPYYWKVDPQGSQLPYIDRIAFEIVQNDEVMLLKATNGEVTLEVPPKPRFATPHNKPILARNRDKGHYRFIDGVAERSNMMVLQPNLTHEDKTKRAIFQNKDFRIGLSYAINRDEVVKIAVQGQGRPSQVAPRPESPFYEEEFATQYLDFDPAQANAYLDKAFPRKNDSGMRLGPTGRPLAFTLEFTPFRPEWADMLELIKGYWKQVGVDLTLKSEARELFNLRIAANKHDASIWHAVGGLDVFMANGIFNYFPSAAGSRYAVQWANWYQSAGSDGERPPAAPRRQMQLFDQIRSTVDPDEQTRLMKEILRISKEQFYVIGTVRETQKYYVAADNIHNVPDGIVEGWTRATPGPSQTEQYFLST